METNVLKNLKYVLNWGGHKSWGIEIFYVEMKLWNMIGILLTI